MANITVRDCESNQGEKANEMVAVRPTVKSGRVSQWEVPLWLKDIGSELLEGYPRKTEDGDLSETLEILESV